MGWKPRRILRPHSLNCALLWNPNKFLLLQALMFRCWLNLSWILLGYFGIDLNAMVTVSGTVWEPSHYFPRMERGDCLRGMGNPAYKNHVNPPFHGHIHIANPSSHIPPFIHEPKFFPIESSVEISVPENFPPGDWAKNFSLAGLAKIFLVRELVENFFKRERYPV
jgi:hypothetical protein